MAGSTRDAPQRRLAEKKGPLSWMARHPVAANLLMFVLVVGGILGAIRAKQEVFPEFTLDAVEVRVPYPGASPADVEQGILLAIEEGVRGIDGVKRVDAVAREGNGQVTVELLLDADPDQVLADVKNEVDRIDTFPEQAEEPTVSLAKQRRQVISLIISGDTDLRVLHGIAERARQDLLATDGVTQVDLEGVPPLEIAIEVSRDELQRYGLSLQQIAAAVGNASLELPGGELETTSGEILVRVAERRKLGHEFANITLRSAIDGSKIELGDIANIRDGYEDNDQTSYFNGQPAVRLTAFRVGDQTPQGVAAMVREYADGLREELPENVTLSIWSDDSEILQDRISLLLENAVWGLVLVLIILALFLDLRLAFWVALGIPISFLGAFLLLGQTDISINMVTLFAFIVTLGMVVDDAIVVGERAYANMARGMDRMDAAIAGAREMAMPVTFAILTTVAAFSPLFFVPGVMGKIFRLIPAVVVAVLLLSLVESFWVLPAHLGHGRGKESKGSTKQRVKRAAVLQKIQGIHRSIGAGLERFVDRVYRPLVALVIRGRYITVAIATAVLLATGGLVAANIVPFNFFPEIEGDIVSVQARLPYGTPLQTTKDAQDRLEVALERAIEAHGGSRYVRGVYTRLGQEIPQRGPDATQPESGSHLVAVQANLVPTEQRPFSASSFVDTWKQETPEIPALESIAYNFSEGPGAGAAVAVQLVHSDLETLGTASEELERVLGEYPILRNIRNEFAEGKPQLDFTLRPQARALGLTANDVAMQLRGAFFGAEAIREQRGRNELKVRVRLPEQERDSEYDLERYNIRTPGGGSVPLGYVAKFDRGEAPTAIHRENARRKVTVSGRLAPGVKSPRDVLADLRENVFPELRERYPDLQLQLVGSQREQREAFAALGQNYVMALLVIFALLAIPFRSYIQPVIVMAAIPFGIVGAVLGHVLMSYTISIISVFGIIALSGVVVNDSLVLIDAANRERRGGADPLTAIIEGGAQRLRPILLTSLTTFFGLVPMITETSIQARFLIPMAISLGFGVLFVTVIALLVVPALYIIIEDAHRLVSRKPKVERLHGGPASTSASTARSGA